MKADTISSDNKNVSVNRITAHMHSIYNKNKNNKNLQTKPEVDGVNVYIRVYIQPFIVK